MFLTEGDHVERQQQDIKETRGGVSDAMKVAVNRKESQLAEGIRRKFMSRAPLAREKNENTQAKSKYRTLYGGISAAKISIFYTSERHLNKRKNMANYSVFILCKRATLMYILYVPRPFLQ